jgi:putative ABC transport system permease protein
VSLFSTFRLALRAIARNRLRSGLTMLGVIIGVGAVIAMVALGEGAKRKIGDQLASLGTNLLMIFPGSTTQGGVRGGAGTATPLTLDDVTAIRREAPAVKRVVGGKGTQAQAQFGSQNWFTEVYGTMPDWLEIRDWKVEKGRFFTQGDLDSATKVCVLGTTVVRELMGNQDPIGQTIRVKQLPCEVIGVLSSKGSSGWGNDQDDQVIMPLTTVLRFIEGTVGNAIGLIQVSAQSAEEMSDAEKQVTDILRQRHRLLPAQENDFTVANMADISEAAGEVAGILAALLGGIASVALFVGGIGIMNIMYVSVTERTREIGIRRAIGARESDILLQFLAEAVMLSLVGGLLGIGLGVGTSYALTTFLGWRTELSIPLMGIAFGIAALVGIFFGFTPARAAARLDPIEALRYE